MDEKNLSSRNLANIMKISLGQVQELLNKHHTPTSTYKSDGSPVTELDIALSDLIEEKLASSYPNFNYFSEEKFDEWKFPLIAVDPLDGTREYVAGRPEWAMSIGIFESEKWQGSGWVCNPVTKEVFERGEKRSPGTKSKYIGEVSRSEWEQGLFTKVSHPGFEVRPMGSIAYKLGKLSRHKIDFVVSLRPKNIWDIAGGTLLCMESGMKFYSQGKEVTKVEKLYLPPLIWCDPLIFPELSQLFPS